MFATFSEQVSPRVSFDFVPGFVGMMMEQKAPKTSLASGPGWLAYRVQRKDVVVSMDDWLADNQALVEARRAEINQKIAAAHARAEERKRINKIREQLWHFDHDLWQPTAGSFERETFNEKDKDRSGSRRLHLNRRTGIGKRQPVLVYRSNTGEQTTVLECKGHHNKSMQKRDPRMPRYKDIRSSQFRAVDKTPLYFMGQLI